MSLFFFTSFASLESKSMGIQRNRITRPFKGTTLQDYLASINRHVHGHSKVLGLLGTHGKRSVKQIPKTNHNFQK